MQRYIGDLTPFNVEMWTAAALVTLQENIVVSNVFNRDFQAAFAERGDVVNTRRLASFNGDRLEESGTLNVEVASASNVQVTLNQHITQAFSITDRDNDRSFQELIEIYIEPSTRAMIEKIDLIALGEKYQFYKNQVATNGPVDYDAVVDTNKIMTSNLAPKDQRFLIGGATFEADILKTDKFTTAEKIGDGSPLANGIVARGSGFTLAMSQMMNETSGSAYATETAVVDNVSGYLKGALTITVDAASTATVTDGEFLTINGYVYRIEDGSGVSTNAGDIIIEAPGLHAAVANDAAVTITTSGAIDNVGGYPVNHGDWIDIDGAATVTRFPELGDGIAFGTAGEVYGVFKVDAGGSRVKLNRPLDVAVADGDIVAIFPAGNYNLAMRPGAATIVVRPMALPIVGNVTAAVSRDSGWALRGIISYNHAGAGSFNTTFSYDTLVGVKTTDVDQGALLISL